MTRRAAKPTKRKPPYYDGLNGHTHQCTVKGCPNSMRFLCPNEDDECPIGDRPCWEHERPR